MSIINFKFRSEAPEYTKPVHFDGPSLSVFDLKREIITVRKIKGDCDIAVLNSQSEQGAYARGPQKDFIWKWEANDARVHGWPGTRPTKFVSHRLETAAVRQGAGKRSEVLECNWTKCSWKCCSYRRSRNRFSCRQSYVRRWKWRSVWRRIHRRKRRTSWIGSFESKYTDGRGKFPRCSRWTTPPRRRFGCILSKGTGSMDKDTGRFIES